MEARRILEVGTSNGYSAIWWADALTDAGQVLVTLEVNPDKAAQVTANLEHAGVADRVRVVQGDAAEFLRRSADASWYLIFLDAERSEYVLYWPDLTRILTTDGLIIVDNAVDKAAELEAFRQQVADTSGYRQVLVPIGNGELFIQRDRP